MERLKMLQKIDELESKIASLPQGSITTKKIKGKVYYYQRINVDKKRHEYYIDFEQVEELSFKIERRKRLEAELKALKKSIPAVKSKNAEENTHEFFTYVRVGEQLKKLSQPVINYKKRECYSALYDYVFGDQPDKVFILYGLRRTGKTTLIRQILNDMSQEQLQKTAFIQIRHSNTLSEINSDLKYLETQGYQYIFIDEVTLLEDFIEGAALFSDIYASCGMKIVLSGTDSLGFVFSESEQLYDRCIFLHTTFIPYREFENVLGIKGIDEFIRYGGTMSISGVDYNAKSSFVTSKSTGEYIDSAIAHNIQHSLKYYQDGGHFRHLYELYERGELTGAINRVVEDINHRFTKEVLTKTFKSSDISISARNLLSDRTAPVDLVQNIDRASVENMLKSMLDILEKDEQTVDIDETHAYQIKEYLELLDLIVDIDIRHFPNVNQKEKTTVISQPGIRYAQADALIKSLLLDEKFINLSAVQRNMIVERILGEIKGRMMEEIVLLETKYAFSQNEVFKLQFDVGEFDMVIYNPDTISCELFEIKYSTETDPNQYRHLIDKDKCADAEYRFGTITGKYVIYRGETRQDSNGIKYINVEEYLKSLRS